LCDFQGESHEDFLNLWNGADPDVPVYRQAKTEYGKLHNAHQFFVLWSYDQVITTLSVYWIEQTSSRTAAYAYLGSTSRSRPWRRRNGVDLSGRFSHIKHSGGG
jgi:hypothetical protein